MLSKLEGGQWGLANLPREYLVLVERALSCYQGKKKDCILNSGELEAFADYMSVKILAESKLRNRSELKSIARARLPELLEHKYQIVAKRARSAGQT